MLFEMVTSSAHPHIYACRMFCNISSNLGTDDAYSSNQSFTIQTSSNHAGINNDSSQYRRPAVVNDTKEFKYVGLTLQEFHSSTAANHKEGPHLMLKCNMTRIPYDPAAKLPLQAVQCHDRHGLQMEEGIRHLNQEQHHHARPQIDIDSTFPTQPLPTPGVSSQVLEWKDTTEHASMNGGYSNPISWMNDILSSHESYKGAGAQVQDQKTLSGNSQIFTTASDPHVPTHPIASHGTMASWLKDGFGDCITRSSTDQTEFDLFDRLQLPPESNSSSKPFGIFYRPRAHSTPTMSSCPINPRGFDPNFCIPVRATSSSSSRFEAECQIPVSQLPRRNLLRSNSAPAPEELIAQANLLPMQSSMGLQLNCGGQDSKATSSAQGLSFLHMASDDLSDHNHESGSESSVPTDFLKAQLDSDLHMDMTRGYSNVSLDSLPEEPTIKLPPLNLETVLGASAGSVPNLHFDNIGDHDENSEKCLTSSEPPTTPFLRDVPSLLRLNSPSAPSSMVDPTHAYVQSESSITPKKKRMAPRRSRFDPHDTPCTFMTERKRREKLTEKYNILKSLIPKSTKVDRASIIEETIAHVRSLKCEVIHLEKMKEEKLIKIKRQKLDAAEDPDGLVFEQSGDVNCQWLKKTSRHGTEVDMRVLEDELLVSIVQKHLPSFLLRVVTALEAVLKLDILNATGSVIEGHDVYNLKVKITGNSCAVASEMMTKILDTVDSVF